MAGDVDGASPQGTGRTGGRAATTGVIAGQYALSVGRPPTDPPEGWAWTLLTDVAALESGHTPSRRHEEYWGGSICWIGIRDATENHGQTIWQTVQTVTELGLANSSARLLPANTVCLSRTASVGYVVVMGTPMATSQDFVNWVCGPKLDHRFLKSVLLAERSSYRMFSHGTTHQTIYFPEVKAFHVCLPPLPEQRAIAHVLGAIDDKIDLNRRMSSTLEEMARALFTSWFVRFDPVRAKMAGQPTGLPAHIEAMFPDALVDSELGEVPEVWGVGPLSSIASLARVTINPLHYPDETFAHFSLPAFDDGQLPLLERGALIQSNKFHLTDDVVLLTKLNPHIARNWMAIRSATHRSVASTEFMPFRAVEGSSREFLYLLFDSVGFRPQYLSLVSGTTGSHQRVQPPAVLAIEIVLPPADIVGEFTRLVAPMLGEAVAMRARNQSLASLRDTLLPKLVSGEVRITDPEAFLRRAGLDTAA